MLNVMDYVNDYYKKLGVSEKLASGCLWAKLKNMEGEWDDGWNPSEHADNQDLEKFCPAGVLPSVLGDSMYELFMKKTLEELLSKAPKHRKRPLRGMIWLE